MAEGPLSAEEISHRGFPSSFRGFDPAEVRAYLVRVANELRAATTRERELQHKLTDAERRAANPVIDQGMLTRALGEETSRVLASAQQAAHELKARAEESVARILREAHEQAQRVRAEAEVVLARRTEEAEAAAGEIRAAARAEADAVVEQAQRDAEAARTVVAEQARQLVQEAQAARARVLGDLARRRRIAHMQVEQLRAGRERLLDAYRVVRRTLDEVADELERVEAEARAAASAAGRRVEDSMGPAEPAIEGGEAAHHDLDDPVLPELQESGEPPQLEPALPAPSESAAVIKLPAEAPDRPEAKVTETTRPHRLPRPPVAQPVVAREERSEEKKLSSLRILRRPKAGTPAGPGTGVPEPPGDEGVRVITGSPAPVEPDAASGAAAPSPSPSIVPGFSWAPPPAPPAPQREPEAALDPPAAAGTVEAAVLVAASPAPPAPSAPSPADAIFARLRAGSAAPVAEDEPSPSAATENSAVPTAGSEPGPDTAAPAPESDTGAGAGEVVDEDELVLQQRDEAVEAIESTLARRLKRALQDEHNDLLDRLRSWRGGPVTPALLPSSEEQAARYGSAARDLLSEAARTGARFSSLDEADPVEADVEDVLTSLTEALVGPLRRGVERGIETCQEDSSVLVESIGAAYRECKSQRLDGLAADATIGAFASGTLSSASGATLRWVVDDGDRPCSDCDDNALAGATPVGQPFPTGQRHPPAHAGCRCLVVVVAP